MDIFGIPNNICQEYFRRFNKVRPLQNVQFCSSSRKAKILTREYNWIFRGLKFETDAEFGQKGTLCKGLKVKQSRISQGRRVPTRNDKMWYYANFRVTLWCYSSGSPTNKRGKTISLMQQGNQTARKRNRKTIT